MSNYTNTEQYPWAKIETDKQISEMYDFIISKPPKTENEFEFERYSLENYHVLG